MLADIGEEQAGRHRLELVAGEPALHPFVKPLAADRNLDRAKEGGAFLIGDIGQPVVGVASLEVDAQPRVGTGRTAIFLDRLAHCIMAERDLLRCDLGPVHRLDDAGGGVGGHALVEPEVGPGGVGGEIARPAVGELMRDQAVVALVPGDEGRGEEGQSGVFHAPEREGRGQDQQIVAAPLIRAVQRLGGGHHLLGIGEFGGGLVEHRRLGPHPGARAKRTEGEVADRDRDQIRRDRLVHLEGELTRSSGRHRLADLGRRHHRG